MTNYVLIDEAMEKQGQVFDNKSLYPVQVRIKLLKKIREVIKKHENDIIDALAKDLGKPRVESLVAEVCFVLNEIDGIIKKLPKWAKPKRMGTPIISWPAKSYIYREPFGKVLVIAPWNYPFQLLFSPLIGAIAAGNTVVLKPSEMTPATSALMTKMIRENFDPSIIAIVEGGVAESTYLLDQKFDYIFYTGNGRVARIVLEKAARNLTPVILELGGKSPCLVVGEVDVQTSAKRIMWGKFFNAGQTCIAPDYVLIERRHYQDFVAHCQKCLKEFYGDNPKKSADFARIVNQNHWERLSKLIVPEDVIIGGEVDVAVRYIAPTLINATTKSAVMEEEIFGPILPIIQVENPQEGFDYIKSGDKPLAAYIFSKDQILVEAFLREVSAGGVTVNDTLVHISNEHLPFGGVGESGMGAYHMHYSYKLFSNSKSVVKRGWFDLPFRYPPYFGKFNLLKRFVRWLG